MTTPTHLRLADVSDLPFILRQEREYMETIEPHALQGWLTVLDQNLELWIDCLPYTLFCVDADGHPLGYVMGRVDGDTATLVSISVLDSHRRQGLGRLLLDAFEQRISSSGARAVELGVYRSNQARLLYQGSGYETTGQDGEYVLFSKMLSPAEGDQRVLLG
ncbi:MULTISPECIES: GNAT family N-acetyltransferase [unclassified Arthrobacter]|uniref:GNAT family N-acetyltransferase n=1 Tax=unclassified Arthrobacter TaxID=235627 RepID=UPI001E634E6E|nr:MULTISPECIES: GNAT family N-acetyltransferase [unclassified Arthrobacter]MCC9145213.1 GNAT family N-acetyltransferase [Arthrobacter sp. zg-Y919]MDK1276441.1 GNAT family N-acetyltransferase [Arthrobacter sp. zg.Y919]WIB01959.1 GNAT family N-acetyltransferase [Arthrobacter sp. zg-Y919]